MGRRNKIPTLLIWLQAWERYSEAVLIFYSIKENELAAHQSKVIKLCSTLPFDIVYNWDKAKRFVIAEQRSKTLITTDYEIDSQYLLYGRNKRQIGQPGTSQDDGTKPKGPEICRKYNYSWQCAFGTRCNYQHICAICNGEHPAKTCRGKDNQKRRRTEIGRAHV